MDCPEAKCFLSCSFREKEKEINDLVHSICKGMNINCCNVSHGYSKTPPDVAKKMLHEAKIFIGVITKREETQDGKWNMPPAVHDEISMAYALNKPMLLFVENGVALDGFIGNYGTHLIFDRNDLFSSQHIENLLKSIHTLKMEAIDTYDIIPHQDSAGYYSEKTSLLIELLQSNDELIWQYSQSKLIHFTREYVSPLKSSTWASFVPQDVDEKIEWEFYVDKGSKTFTAEITTHRDTPNNLDISVVLSPNPVKGDICEMSFYSRSKYLNARSLSEVPKDQKNFIGEKNFHCSDGVIPVQRTKYLTLQFRFPKAYKFIHESILPFVGSYSTSVDYLVESEMKRLNSQITQFAGNTIVDLSIESPLLGHYYGICWDLTE